MTPHWPRAWIVGGAALGWLLVSVSPVQAERKKPVKIDSVPSGAAIYIDDPDGDPLGETPYSGTLEPGDYTLVFELDGYETSIESFTVRSRSRKRQRLRVELVAKPVGFVILRSGTPGEKLNNATILIDREMREVEEDQRIELPAGAHQIEVRKKGYRTFEAWIEVSEGMGEKVSVTFLPGDDDDIGDFGGGGKNRRKEENPLGDGDDNGEKVEKKGAIVGAPDLAFLAAGIEWGGRIFRYGDRTVFRDTNLVGPRLRIQAETYPLANYDKWLGGIGLSASLGLFVFPGQSTTKPDDGICNTCTVDNKWLDYSLDARYRYAFSDALWAALSVGFSRDTVDYTSPEPENPESIALIDQLASVDYQRLQVGIHGGTSSGRFDVFGSVFFNQILDAGDLTRNATNASVTSFGVRGGARTPAFSGVDATASVSYGYNSLTFDDQTGSDQFFAMLLGLGYAL